MLLDSATAQTHTNIAAYFGDGDSCVSTTGASSGSGKIVMYKFSCVHVYDGPGIYKPYFIDNYRISGIKNITNSSTKSMTIFSLLSINAFTGPNTTPLYSVPIASVNVGNILNYNPGLSDIDGDSLSYHLVNCIVTPTTAYYIPANSSLNNSTGTLTYQADTVGLYSFKFLVKEWRKDVDSVFQLIGETEIDFVVDVVASVGIKELDKKESIGLYPNPTSSILNIKTNSKTISEIEIINSLGQTVLKQKYSESIDVSKLSPGCYFIRINNSYSKFIKE